MNAGLADVTTTPLTPGSAIAASAAATYSLMLSSDSTFMDRPGMSQVSVTMPSASLSTRMLVMDYWLRKVAPPPCGEVSGWVC